MSDMHTNALIIILVWIGATLVAEKLTSMVIRKKSSDTARSPTVGVMAHETVWRGKAQVMPREY